MRKINSKEINSKIINRFIRLISTSDFQTTIKKAALCCITIFIFITLMITVGGCATMQTKGTKDSIDNLSFSHDGKKVIFDRCRDGCQIQVYDLETGDLSAYQSPSNERWTMGRQSHDGKKIVFSVMPVIDGHVDLSEMQIAVMDADGKNFKKITTGPGAKLYPTFSHSGRKVLYVRAAYMRKSGKTPAAKYDAWEVDLTTGSQTQLTFFKYFQMDYLAYLPDNERFIYYGILPEAFPGLDLPKGEPRKAQEMIRQEQMKRNIGIAGILVMKRGEDLPQRHYNFGKGFNAERPLLSRDGSKLIFEKAASAGQFYLYSEDGNHKHIGGGGTIYSAAISPDGMYYGFVAAGVGMHIYGVSDGSHKERIYVPTPRSEGFDYDRLPKYKLLSEKPLKIINK